MSHELSNFLNLFLTVDGSTDTQIENIRSKFIQSVLEGCSA
jgi:hypothetical protein